MNWGNITIKCTQVQVKNKKVAVSGALQSQF